MFVFIKKEIYHLNRTVYNHYSPRPLQILGDGAEMYVNIIDICVLCVSVQMGQSVTL